MKKLILKTVIVLCVCVVSIDGFSQIPNMFTYQAVIRDNNNLLLANASVGMKISILKGSNSGSAVYEETHIPVTNGNGLINIQIGAGSVVSGSFSTIDWSTGLYWVKTETDPLGGTSYTISGTSQLLSTPYALYAEKTKSSSHYIGEEYGGGIVFYVYDNGQHGLIVAKEDLNGGALLQWSINGVNSPAAYGDGIGAGKGNTLLIIADQKAGDGTNYGAKLSNEYNVIGLDGVKYGDWYLPSLHELNLLYQSRTSLGGLPLNGKYMSSLENLAESWSYYSKDFTSGVDGAVLKGSPECLVRAIRSF